MEFGEALTRKRQAPRKCLRQKPLNRGVTSQAASHHAWFRIKADCWRSEQSERTRFLICGGSDYPTSLKREQGAFPRSRAAFGGHAGLCWSFRLVANRLASDPFDPNGAMMGTQVSH